MATNSKKPLKAPSTKESTFQKDSKGKEWKKALKKSPVLSHALGWKTQGSGRRLPLKHHK